jgi:trigger factor
MHVKKTNNSPTSVTLSFVGNKADLSPIKQQTVARLGRDLKLSGFRPGKAPTAIIEKNLDQSVLQTEVIEEAINSFYVKGLDEYRLRPVSRPEVSIKKFVPFTTLEFETKADVIGEITLPDYTKIKKAKPTTKITEKEVAVVVKSLQTRLAERKDVDRAAKNGDQVMIDFKGVDDKGEPVNGAEGKGYPLVLGSNTFIPGFENNIIGMEPAQENTFTIKFPKDYNVAALASKDVTFTVTATTVQEIVEPEVNDEFAAKAGPFKTLAELTEDIKKQLTQEREIEAQHEYEQALIEEIASKSKVVIPDALIEEQLDVAEQEEKQNLVYRGQTWEEHLKQEGVTEKEHRDQNRDKAAMRVKAGLVLSEISEKEGLDVTPEELEIRIQLLKGQYQDAAMQTELDKPENRRDIGMRMLTEKTIEKLVGYASGK